jgi:hypothetical protein
LNSDTVENDRTVPLHRERSASLKCVWVREREWETEGERVRDRGREGERNRGRVRETEGETQGEWEREGKPKAYSIHWVEEGVYKQIPFTCFSYDAPHTTLHFTLCSDKNAFRTGRINR